MTQHPLRRAFTLIELLVVIAIISLLVSILLPSLQKAKDLAKLVTCSTQLNQLNMAGQMYFYDMQQYWGNPSTPPSAYWYRNTTVDQECGWPLIRLNTTDASGNPTNYDVAVMNLLPYLGYQPVQEDPGVLECPTDPGLADPGYWDRARSYFYSYPNMYDYCQRPGISRPDLFDPVSISGKRDGDVPSPGKTLTFMDSGGQHGPSLDPLFGTQLRNYSFADGHVVSMEYIWRVF